MRRRRWRAERTGEMDGSAVFPAEQQEKQHFQRETEKEGTTNKQGVDPQMQKETDKGSEGI